MEAWSTTLLEFVLLVGGSNVAMYVLRILLGGKGKRDSSSIVINAVGLFLYTAGLIATHHEQEAVFYELGATLVVIFVLSLIAAILVTRGRKEGIKVWGSLAYNLISFLLNPFVCFFVTILLFMIAHGWVPWQG